MFDRLEAEGESFPFFGLEDSLSHGPLGKGTANCALWQSVATHATGPAEQCGF